jgi:hypothetical protein
MTFRLTRTTLRGQFADDRCFLDFIAGYPTEHVRIETWNDDPMNDGGANDRRFYVWWHDVEVKVPPNCNPDLISDGGKNGWATAAEVGAVLKRLFNNALEQKQRVEVANREALSAANLARSAVEDVKGAVSDVITGKTFGTVGKVAIGAGLIAGVLWLASFFRR